MLDGSCLDGSWMGSNRASSMGSHDSHGHKPHLRISTPPPHVSEVAFNPIHRKISPECDKKNRAVPNAVPNKDMRQRHNAYHL